MQLLITRSDAAECTIKPEVTAVIVGHRKQNKVLVACISNEPDHACSDMIDQLNNMHTNTM